VFVCCIVLRIPGSRKERSCWKHFAGLCLGTGCGKYLRSTDGIFCANFYSKLGRSFPCKSAWCGSCYKPTSTLDFPIKMQVDEDGEEIRDPGEESRFLEARAGDHLMTPFQCGTCHFRNVMGRNPVLTTRILNLLCRVGLKGIRCRVTSLRSRVWLRPRGLI
jgi:hypothetical protein